MNERIARLNREAVRIAGRGARPHSVAIGLGVGMLGAAVAAGARIARHRARVASVHGYRYSPAYRERLRLRDGTRVLLRLIRPGDKIRLAEGLASLSLESRYRRFHVPKVRFTEAELRYLTELDGVNHFAIGAQEMRGTRRGLGVARFVRLSQAPDRADAAIVVRDDVQHRGLGRILLRRLCEAARERGIEVLSCEVLAQNSPAIRLVEEVGHGSVVWRDGPVVCFEIPTTHSL